MTADARMPTDREIVISRLIDAPQERVFDAWTDPEQVVQWWGPNGFTTTTYKMEVKPGGVWRFVMHGPDGRDHQNKITYLEVVRPERLVFEHGGDDDLEPVSFVELFECLGVHEKHRIAIRLGAGLESEGRTRCSVVRDGLAAFDQRPLAGLSTDPEARLGDLREDEHCVRLSAQRFGSGDFSVK